MLTYLCVWVSVCVCAHTFFHSFFSLSFFRNKCDLLRLCGIVQSLQVVQIQSKNDYNAGTLCLSVYTKPTSNSAHSIVIRSHIILPVDLRTFVVVEFKTLSNFKLFINSIPIICKLQFTRWNDRISVILGADWKLTFRTGNWASLSVVKILLDVDW